MMHRDIAYALALQEKLDEAIAESQKGIALLDALGLAGEPREVGALSELAEMYVAREHKGDVFRPRSRPRSERWRSARSGRPGRRMPSWCRRARRSSTPAR